MPINITYDNTSTLDDVNNLNSFITTSLDQYRNDEYAESTLQLTLQANVPTNQTKLECTIGNIGNDSVFKFVNSSGEWGKIIPYACMTSPHSTIY